MAITRSYASRLLCVLVVLTACSPGPEPSRVEQLAALPDWSGIWVPAGENQEADISGFAEGGKNLELPLLGLDQTVPYNETWAARVRAATKEWSFIAKTRYIGYPVMMQHPAPLEFLITPAETLIVNSENDVRHVYTDGREHLPEEDRWPTYWGDSVGRWDGDTLVISTVSVKRVWVDNLLSALGEQEVFSAPALSEQAHYTERLRKTGRNLISGEITIEDPIALTKPWVVKLSWKRAAGLDRMFPVDFDNDRVRVGEDGLIVVPSK